MITPNRLTYLIICCLLLYILLRRRYNRRLTPVFWQLTDKIVLVGLSTTVIFPCIGAFLTVGSCFFDFVVPGVVFSPAPPYLLMMEGNGSSQCLEGNGSSQCLEGDGSNQWSPIPDPRSPKLEPLFLSEPSDPPTEPGPSTPAPTRPVTDTEWVFDNSSNFNCYRRTKVSKCYPYDMRQSGVPWVIHGYSPKIIFADGQICDAEQFLKAATPAQLRELHTLGFSRCVGEDFSTIGRTRKAFFDLVDKALESSQ